MDFLTYLGVFNYGLVLFYGLFLSVMIAGGWKNKAQRNMIFAMCPVFCLIQTPCWLFLGVDTVKQMYPLIVHLPLTLILIFIMKKSVGEAIVCVCTAYLCCQLPHWFNIAVIAISGSALAGEIAYTVVIVPLFLLLLRYFVGPAHDTMTYSRRTLLLFGSLPAAYYIFDYATVIYTDMLYAGIQALNELLPTVLILFYVIFLSAYHHEMQQRTKAELESSALSALFKQSQSEMDALRQRQTQTAIYQHDMRHHLNMIDGFLAAGKPQQASDYIRKTRDDITAVSVKRYCENDAVNLICSSFEEKAKRIGIALTMDAKLPAELTLSDTELCAILSNALENALNAAANSKVAEKWIRLYCSVKLNKLLIEVKNPYSGEISMRDGIPVSAEAGHGFGCRSIQAIVAQHHGLYSFEPTNGVFTMRVALPI